MRYEGVLQQQTKELDSSMQQLVYENYNKFIHATNTIREMRTSVESMEAEMGTLVARMEGITGLNARVSDRLAPNRSRIEKLVGVRRLLTRLEFLFELPERLKQCITLAAYAQVRFARVCTFSLT